jgi:hypothetical protein
LVERWRIEIFWGQSPWALLIRRKALDRWYDFESKAAKGALDRIARSLIWRRDRQFHLASRDMASKHLLQGLIKWSMRDPWRDRFDQILEDHLLPACDETGVATDDVVSIVGQDLFMSTVWACAFEDFLTREFEDGANAVDEYLKRRGWKEPASVRTYMPGCETRP